jgi:hypothetical protein
MRLLLRIRRDPGDCEDSRRLSARVFHHVLNQPLYDGGCSQKARELLASGNVEKAIEDWRRLSDLGSGSARCVLAYIYFRGAPTIIPDLNEAKRLAVLAAPVSSGYANYLLGCFALSEGAVNTAVEYFKLSYEASFAPVLTLLAWTRFRDSVLTGKSQENAERLALLAINSGHLPAHTLLARMRLSGRLGLMKLFYGAIVLPLATTLFTWRVRRDIFSLDCFYYSPTFKLPLFDTSSIERMRQAQNTSSSKST